MAIYKFKLKQPYWGGWKKYGWTKGDPAFGISLDQVKKSDYIEIVFQGNTYVIASLTALELAKKYNSYFTTKYGNKLIEVPKSAFNLKAKKYLLK